MGVVGFRAVTGAAVALAAATAKTVLGVKAGTGDAITLRGFTLSFDGITASALPVLVEVGKCTFATNVPGTASTSITPTIPMRGPASTPLSTAGKNWTTEPTVITVIDEFWLDPNKGLYPYTYPLGADIESVVSQGFVLRLTAPAIVNFRGAIEWEG